MKAYEEVEFYLHPFSTEVLEGGGRGVSGAGRLIRRNRVLYLLQRRLRVPPRPSGCFAGKKKRKGILFFLPGMKSLCLIVQPLYRAYAITILIEIHSSSGSILYVHACNIRISTQET